MRNALLLTAVLLAAAAAVFAIEIRGADAATRVDLTLTEYKINMTSATVPAGVPVTFAATNKGQTMHEVVLEKVGAVDQPLEINGGEAEIANIAPGETKSATWTITQPGVYQLACHVPGHFEAGMVQQFTVISADGGENGQVSAPVQLAAPSTEDQSEHETRPAAGAALNMIAATPVTLPLTGGVVSIAPLWWFAAAIVFPIVAAYGVFRLIVQHIRKPE